MKALLLIGSPKPGRSTSESLGTYLLDSMGGKGIETGSVKIWSYLKDHEKEGDLLKKINKADILLFAFPLYVDSLPWPVTRAFELIHRDKMSSQNSPRKKMAIIINCGFPEAFHNNVAVSICEEFARQSQLEWLGALALGNGGAIHGKSLEKAGPIAKKPRKALEKAALHLAKGKAISKDAIDLMAKPMMPRWLYTFMGNMGWKRQAKKYGAKKKIWDRPYINK